MKLLNEEALIIFAKYPEAGKVKTRLAKTKGKEFATSFYKSCAEHTFDVAAQVKNGGVDVYLFYSSNETVEKIKNWVQYNFHFKKQFGNDLGARMYNALKQIFNDGIKKIVIIGTDAPDISVEIVKDAFNDLTNYDYAIGPATDGGYYLLATRILDENVFLDIKWSNEEVLKKTLSNIKNAGYGYRLLTELRDIDTEEDLVKWMKCNTNLKSRVAKFTASKYSM